MPLGRLPWTDVVIPTIGRHSLLRAVRSVLEQTIPVRVIVVLDDPDSEGEVRDLLPRDGRLRLIKTQGWVGGAAARNIGIDASTGPSIAFLDDDDWWEHDSLARRLATISPTDVGDAGFFVAGAFWHERADGASHVPRDPPPYDRISELAAYLVERRDLRFGRAALQSSTMVMSTRLARMVRWEPALAKHQDWDFALRLLSSPGISTGWLDSPTVHVEKDSVQSISKRMNALASLEFLQRHPELRGRARADFLAVHVLRASLDTRSLAWFGEYLRAGPGTPHLAALVVAASAIAKQRTQR